VLLLNYLLDIGNSLANIDSISLISLIDSSIMRRLWF